MNALSLIGVTIVCLIMMAGFLLIAWWSDRDHKRQLDEHSKRIDQIYREQLVRRGPEKYHER